MDQILAELAAQLARLSKAALEAHASATDPGSKAEGKYDTRSLEASYLATGQARQAEELAEAIRVFGVLRLPDHNTGGAIMPVRWWWWTPRASPPPTCWPLRPEA